MNVVGPLEIQRMQAHLELFDHDPSKVGATRDLRRRHEPIEPQEERYEFSLTSRPHHLRQRLGAVRWAQNKPFLRPEPVYPKLELTKYIAH